MRMRTRARSAWLLLPIVVGGVAYAAVGSGTGENEASSDAAPSVVAAKAAKNPGVANAAASDAEAAHERKKIRLDPELATALYRVGLQPERLAAAGVEAAITDDLVVNVKTWLAEHPADLSQADDALFQATKTRDELVRKVRSGLASPDEIEACSNAAAAYISANAARTAKLEAIFNAGTQMLTSEQAILLNRLQTNAQAWNIPLEYLVLERTQEEWVRTRAALANEKISAKYGEDPDDEDQAHLATVRALNEVVAAKVSLDTNLGTITDAWEEAAAAAEGEGQ
jgi:hypothetical protein